MPHLILGKQQPQPLLGLPLKRHLAGEVKLSAATGLSQLASTSSAGFTTAVSAAGTESASRAGASWPAWMSDFPFRQRISITGSSAGTQTYSVVPVMFHYGRRIGNAEPGNVWFDGNCNPDFSDIRICDGNGVEIPYTIAIQGNFDIVPDSRLGRRDSLIISRDYPEQGLHKGDIIATNPGSSQTVGVSRDNGATWETRCGFPYGIRLLTSTGVLIGVNDLDGVYRSLDGGFSWDLIYDLRPYGSSSTLLYQGVTEDDRGDVFIGVYAGPTGADGSPNYATVVKITRDHITAPTWSDAYATICLEAGPTTPVKDTNWQIHAIQADPYRPGTIYAIGADPMPAVYETTDYGATWTTIKGGALETDHYCDIINMSFTPDYVYFGTEGSMCSPSSRIYRWDRGSEWVKLFHRGAPLGNLFHLGNNWYGCTLVRPPDYCPRIWRSADINDDSNWTVAYAGKLAPPYTSDTQFVGWYYQYGVGTPTGDDEQCIVSADNANTVGTHTTVRVYDGGNHYYALAHLLLPDVPSTGTFVDVYYGNSDAQTASTPLESIFGDYVDDPCLVAHYSFDWYDGDTSLQSDVGPDAHLIGTGPHPMPVVNSDNQGYAIGPLLQPYTPGRYITQLPGSSFFQLNNAPGDQLDLDQHFTIVAWVKIDTFAAKQDFNFLIAKGWNETMQYGLYVSRPADPKLRGLLGFQYHTAGVAGGAHNTDGPSVGDGAWHQVGIIVGARTGTYPDTSSQTCRFVVNGVVGDVVTIKGPGIKKMTDDDGNPYHNVSIGAMAHPNYAVSPFVGSYDDIRIYSRELTAQEIQELYELRPIASPEVAVGSRIQSIALSQPSAVKTATAPVSYTVTYDGAASVSLKAADITLTRTGTANGVVAVTGSGNATRTVTVSSLEGTGTLAISIAADTAVDDQGNPAPAVETSDAFVVDNSPPAMVQFGYQLYTRSSTDVKVHWEAVDPDTDIDSYEYAVGTTRGGRDIRDWTTVSGEDYTIAGLSLELGKLYYISARATNGVGLKSNAACGPGLRLACPLSCTRTIADGNPACVVDAVLSAKFSGAFYLEDANRAAGIRIEQNTDLAAGQTAIVSGTLTLTSDGERTLKDAQISGGDMGQQIQPIAIPVRSIGGASAGFCPGITGGTGANNVGLLVKTFGQVTGSTPTGFYLWDGSNVTDETGNQGVFVFTGSDGLGYEGSELIVTGIVSCRQAQNHAYYPVVLATQIAVL